MKRSGIIVMMLAAMILIPAIAGGCRKYSQAEWDAGRLYTQDKSWQKCRHRVAIVARDMMKRGETFELVFGEASWNKERHVRIEQWTDASLGS